MDVHDPLWTVSPCQTLHCSFPRLDADACRSKISYTVSEARTTRPFGDRGAMRERSLIFKGIVCINNEAIAACASTSVPDVAIEIVNSPCG